LCCEGSGQPGSHGRVFVMAARVSRSPRRQVRRPLRPSLLPRVRRCLLLLAAATGLVLPPLAVLGDPSPKPREVAVPQAPAVRDMMLTIHIRRALAADEEVARCNLTIQVRGGVVTLQGAVPTPEVARRAEALAKKVPGVEKVQNKLYVSAQDDEVRTLPVPDPEPPSATASASPDRATGSLGTLTGRVPVIALPPSGRTASSPSPGPAATTPAAATTPSPAGSAAPPRRTPAVSLLPPVSLGAPEVAPAAPVPQPAPAASVQESAERLRSSDPRFQRIRLDVRGGVIGILPADDVPGEHVMALAQALSRLPGVERVLVQSRSGSR
jgi:hypothetical protein